MRITGGALRGRKLYGPDEQSARALQLRPSADRLREAVFNLLHNGALDQGAPPHPPEPPRPLTGLRALDLFAGTGALGFEALSRGAVYCVFIEENAAPRALIRRNMEALDLIGASKLYRRDATRLGPCRGAPFDLVFADPPYRKALGARALQSALEGGWLASGALIMLEMAHDEAAPAIKGLELRVKRAYGEGALHIYHKV